MADDLGDVAREYAERFGSGDDAAAADVQLQAKILEMLGVLSQSVSDLQARVTTIETIIVKGDLGS